MDTSCIRALKSKRCGEIRAYRLIVQLFVIVVGPQVVVVGSDPATAAAPSAVNRRSVLTGALLDRITHHVNILEMNGDSYRLAQSRARKPG